MERDVLVEDYMIRDVVIIRPDRTVDEAIDILVSTEFHGLPVAENGHLVGFITAKELLRARNRPKECIREIVKSGSYSVGPKDDLDYVTRVLFRHSLRNLPVVDKGRLVGVISNIDVVRSNIERATPKKVDMLRRFLEDRHKVRIELCRGLVSIDDIRPTQKEIYSDEFVGRQYELRRGLIEPIIVIERKGYYLLVDGHHRVLAAKEMGVLKLNALILKLSKDIELGIERSAEEMGLQTLDDVKIIEDIEDPFLRVRTRNNGRV